mgnify:CR=1 FL=1
MKITRLRTYPRAVEFSELDPGDTFYMDGDCAEDNGTPILYMKVHPIDGFGRKTKYHYVDMESGELYDDADKETAVVPIKSTLTVEA